MSRIGASGSNSGSSMVLPNPAYEESRYSNLEGCEHERARQPPAHVPADLVEVVQARLVAVRIGHLFEVYRGQAADAQRAHQVADVPRGTLASFVVAKVRVGDGENALVQA